MNVKQYLGQIKRLDDRIYRRVHQVEELRNKAIMISSVDTSRDRIQSSPSGDNMRYVEKYVDMMRGLNELIDNYTHIKNKIIGEIESLNNEKYSEVLYYRYVEYLIFPEIADRMNYSKDYVWKIHRKALKEFERTVNDY